MQHCPRSLIFGGTATVEQYKGNPRVQAHGPGFSKILLGDDKVDEWEKYLDIMGDSVFVNSRPRLHQLLRRLGVAARQEDRRGHRRQDRPGRSRCRRKIRSPRLAAFTVKGQADAINAQIDQDVKEAGVIDLTAKYGPRLVKKEHCDYLRPTVIYCENPEKAIAKKEFMFPFVTVVECPQDKMLEAIGPTLVCSAITEDAEVPAGPGRRDAHRPAQHRPAQDDRAELAAAARREHRRFPVPGPGVPVRQGDDSDMMSRSQT